MNIIHSQGLVACMSHVEEFVTGIKIGSDQAHILLIQKKMISRLQTLLQVTYKC